MIVRFIVDGGAVGGPRALSNAAAEMAIASGQAISEADHIRAELARLNGSTQPPNKVAEVRAQLEAALEHAEADAARTE